jgi:hypothetical protein
LLLPLPLLERGFGAAPGSALDLPFFFLFSGLVPSVAPDGAGEPGPGEAALEAGASVDSANDATAARTRPASQWERRAI